MGKMCKNILNYIKKESVSLQRTRIFYDSMFPECISHILEYTDTHMEWMKKRTNSTRMLTGKNMFKLYTATTWEWDWANVKNDLFCSSFLSQLFLLAAKKKCTATSDMWTEAIFNMEWRKESTRRGRRAGTDTTKLSFLLLFMLHFGIT